MRRVRDPEGGIVPSGLLLADESLDRGGLGRAVAAPPRPPPSRGGHAEREDTENQDRCESLHRADLLFAVAPRAGGRCVDDARGRPRERPCDGHGPSTGRPDRPRNEASSRCSLPAIVVYGIRSRAARSRLVILGGCRACARARRALASRRPRTPARRVRKQGGIVRIVLRGRGRRLAGPGDRVRRRRLGADRRDVRTAPAPRRRPRVGDRPAARAGGGRGAASRLGGRDGVHVHAAPGLPLQRRYARRARAPSPARSTGRSRRASRRRGAPTRATSSAPATSSRDGRETARGVVARGTTLVVRLKRPIPEFPHRTTVPVCGAAGPAGRPGGASALSRQPARTTSPSTGRATTAVLRRNRYYGGRRPQHVDGFTADLRATSPDEVLDRVERGRGRTGAVRCPRSTSTPGGGSLRPLRRQPLAVLRHAGRDDVRVRPQHRRVRSSATTHSCGRRSTSPSTGRPSGARAGSELQSALTDQYLPPGFPGFRDAHVYPLERAGSDASAEARARQHAKRQGGPLHGRLSAASRGRAEPAARPREDRAGRRDRRDPAPGVLRPPRRDGRLRHRLQAVGSGLRRPVLRPERQLRRRVRRVHELGALRRSRRQSRSAGGGGPRRARHGSRRTRRWTSVSPARRRR